MHSKRTLLKNLVLLLITLSCSYHLKASHIIGGDIAYECVSMDFDNRSTIFKIHVQMYRDSDGGGAQFDNFAHFGVYLGSDQDWELFKSPILVSPDTTYDIRVEEDPCITLPPNIGVQAATYTFELTIFWSDKNYKIAYQRCCRNASITNIRNPSGTGAVFEIEITPEAQRSCNNSPFFNSVPPVIICANFPSIIDLSANDAEGDELVYEFCTPLSSGGPTLGITCNGSEPAPDRCPPPYGEVEFVSPLYSQDAPLGDQANLELDPTTGRLTLVPQVLGQFVMRLCVKEYRDGELLSVLSRDIQLNVNVCEAAAIASISGSSSKIPIEYDGDCFFVKSCDNGRSITFENNSQSTLDNPQYEWEFNAGLISIESKEKDPTIQFPEFGTYTSNLIVNRGSLCSDTALIKIDVNPAISSNFTFKGDSCTNGPLQLIDATEVGENVNIASWEWLIDENEPSSFSSPIISFDSLGMKAVRLIVTDSNECIDTMSKQISWFPAPDLVLIEPSSLVDCAPSTIQFNNLSRLIDDTFETNWSFGDGNNSPLSKPMHIYQNPGIYDVSLSIISPTGCEVLERFLELVEILPSPIADYTFIQNASNSLSQEIQFKNKSQNANGYYWQFGTFGASYDESPNFTFPDTGLVHVDLISFHPLGCSDTMTQHIDFEPKLTYFLPNAFTPNNDGLNDTFVGKGRLEYITEFNLQIWNRWGEMIYESDNPAAGWNGEYNNSGKPAPKGVYVYNMVYKGPRRKLNNKKGQVTLIR